MKKINLELWDRKDHYLFYLNMDIPQYTLTFEVEITPLIHYIKKNGFPFYLSMIYFVMKTTQQIEAFRYRIWENEVVLFDRVHPSFTDMESQSSLFKIVSVDMEEPLETFIQSAQNHAQNQTEFIDLSKEKRQDWVFITSFPWARYTSLTNAMNIDPKDAIPRISWGRFTEQNGRITLPLTLGVHHGFVDGYHISLWLNAFDQMLKNLK